MKDLVGSLKLRYRTYLGRVWLAFRSNTRYGGDRKDEEYTGHLFDARRYSGLPIRHFVMGRINGVDLVEINYEGHVGKNGQFIDSVY